MKLVLWTSIQGVALGDCLLCACRSDAEPAYAETDFLERYKTSGKPVQVEEGASLAVTLDSVLSIAFSR